MMLFATLALLLSASTTETPPAPPAQSLQASAKKPANPVEARAGNLHIIQLWSSDQQRFLKEWKQPTPPHLTTDSSIERNKPIFQFIIIGGCQANEAGNCDLSGETRMTGPDGKPYGEPLNFAVWDNLPAPPPNILSLAPAGIGLTVEDGEKLGPYKIKLSVTDNVAKVTATTEVTITAEEAAD
ncbi:MAG: hypothetical protein V3V15_01515 [Sphingorhabdus sp.]